MLEQAVENDTVLVTNSNGKVQSCQVLTAIANLAASSAHAQIIAATANAKIRVIQLVCQAGGTATNITFESSTGNAAVTPTFQNGVNGGIVLPKCGSGWFNDTAAGDALNASTGVGSTTGILIKYILVL